VKSQFSHGLYIRPWK